MKKSLSLVLALICFALPTFAEAVAFDNRLLQDKSGYDYDEKSKLWSYEGHCGGDSTYNSIYIAIVAVGKLGDVSTVALTVNRTNQRVFDAIEPAKDVLLLIGDSVYKFSNLDDCGGGLAVAQMGTVGFRMLREFAEYEGDIVIRTSSEYDIDTCIVSKLYAMGIRTKIQDIIDAGVINELEKEDVALMLADIIHEASVK